MPSAEVCQRKNKRRNSIQGRIKKEGEEPENRYRKMRRY